MGKISVFKFKINDGVDENEVKALLESYLSSRGFAWNSELNYYSTGQPSKEEKAKNMALSIGVSLASAAVGGTFGHVFSRIEYGFEYFISAQELIIKAYLVVKGKKKFIHSTFNNPPAADTYYSDLRNVLFKALAEMGVEQTEKEVEKE